MTNSDGDEAFGEPGADDTFADQPRSYLDHLCQYRDPLQTVFALCVAGLAINLLGLLFYSRESVEFTITAVNVFGLCIPVVGIMFVLRRC